MGQKNAAARQVPPEHPARVVSRRKWIGLAVAGIAGVIAVPTAMRAFGSPNGDGARPHLTVYKSPTCGCCGKWIEHVKAAGFTVTVEDTPDVSVVKNRHRVPRALWSCHTTVVGAYAIEGHVPADLIERLVAEHPAIAGIAVPGMPQGSPGMEQGMGKETYSVLTFTRDGVTATYAVR